MTQAKAIERGYTHFIEVWRSEEDREGHTKINKGYIHRLDKNLKLTRNLSHLYTVAIFLIKPKQ